MAKFCAECGGPLGPVDKFCAECGKKVVNVCPTCGQNWDGLKKETVEAESLKPKQSATATPQVPTPVAPQSNKVPQKSTQLTSARVQPVYGSQFNPGADCPNCGSKGNKKSCSNCGAGE